MSGQTKVGVIGAVIFLAFAALGRVGGIVVDWLWFESVGLQSIFATRFFAQAILFVVAALTFFILFMVNAVVAARLASRGTSSVVRIDSADGVPIEVISMPRPGQLDTLIKFGAIGVGIVLSILMGTRLMSSWDIVLRVLNSTAFGAVDPIFAKDISFFVFTLPVYELLQGWFMAAVLLTLLGAVAIYAVKLVLPQIPLTGEATEGQMPSINIALDISHGIKAHLSILVALLTLGFAWNSWLDIYRLVYEPSGLVFGAGYADINARWPGLWLIIAATLLFTLLILLNIRRRGYRLAVIGLAAWVGVSFLAGGIYPGMVQRLQVLPSELDKERPYLEYNISSTNTAYKLDRVEEVDYPAEDAVTSAELEGNPATIKNIRLWDPEPLLNTYNQIQSIRLYYDFLDVDVDRYVIDGEYRQVMLSARELSPAKLPAQAQTWINKRLQFTHGYGVAMSPVNEVTPEGLPELFLKDVPPRGKLAPTRPEIYFGENTNDWVIVKTNTAEFDYPKGDENVYVQYQGDSGVDIGSYLSRLFFSWQFGDPNILLAGAITPESKIIYNRNVMERVKKVAPFLTYDRDPYLVVTDDRLYWILDAYTQSDRYPYSQPVSVAKNRVNYLRNSVKVTVDAYDGTMRFYLADASDPLVHTYSAMFPGLFAPIEDMPKDLRSHLRYPQDLFKVQAELYRTYHMKDPRVFYNREDMWNIPSEIYGDKQVPMEPYYVIMRLPGEAREEFALILPYTPPAKNNMITWLAARSEGDVYGKLVSYKYPKEKLIFGPMQIEARIDQDPRISEQLTLWNQAGSRVIRGNMIVIPVGKSNLYVEPIYLQSEQTKLPEMKRVILATGNKIVMEPTVSLGLGRLFPAMAAPAAPGAPAVPAASPPPVTPQRAPDLKDVGPAGKALLDRYSKLQEEMKTLETDLRRLLESMDVKQ